MRGAWIEMQQWVLMLKIQLCRSPCGERGLKYEEQARADNADQSLPMRGAWIEIPLLPIRRIPILVAPHAGGVD